MKKIIFLIGGLLTVFIFGEFSQPQTTAQKISDEIIASFFRPKGYWVKPAELADSNIKYIGLQPSCCGTKEEQITTNYAVEFCESSPAHINYMLYMRFDPQAYWNHTSFAYDEKMRSEFKKISGGQDILKSRIPTLAPYYGADKPELRFYNAQAIQAAFNAVYRKPTDKFNGINLQKIYNVTIKQFVRETAIIVVKVMGKKVEFEKFANQYLEKAKKDKEFEGTYYTEEVTKKLLGEDLKEFPCMKSYNARIVSVMLRRQLDGSLPTLLNCLKTVLKDYDAEYFAKVGNKF